MSLRLIELVERLPRSRIALIGDFMLDRYLYGGAERLSPEAPVPILHFHREEQRLGGAGSVAADLAALGAAVQAIGVVGQDEAGRTIIDKLRGCDANVDAVVQVPDRPTVTKMRLLGSSHDRTPQQMIRLDIEDAGPIGEPTAQALLRHTAVVLDSSDLLCIEDYNKGVLTEWLCREAISLARKRGIPVVIDPAYITDYGKYAGATALKLNRPEAERAASLPVRKPEQCQAAAQRLLDQLGLEAVVITLNEQGAYLATREGERAHLQTRPRQVADATGAGDMVLATIAVARCAGATWNDAVALANIAGGLEVEKLGCVPITPREIIHDLLLETRDRLGKQRTLKELLPELARHRGLGKKVVFTNGCFDLIHHGHVKYFQFARQQGDLLVVAVNTDSCIRRLKGQQRPIISQADRMGVLEEFASIDYLILFEDDTPLPLIEQIRPDVLVKGEDYGKQQVVGWDVVESYGGRVALAPLMDGRSTSAVIQRILEAYGAGRK